MAAPATGQRVLDLDATDRPVNVTTEPLFRVGGAEATGPDAFESVNAVAFDGAGNLYVLDSGQSRISVFDQAGAFVRAIGRAGGGPGEFRRVWTFAVREDGTVVATDVLPDRLVVFGPDGNHQRSWITEAEEGELGRPIVLAGPDHVVSAAQLFTMDGLPSLGADRGVATSRPVLHFPLAGGTGTVIHRAFVSHPAARGATAEPRRAFDAAVHVAGLPDGRVAVADTVGYVIDLVEPATGALTVLRRPLPPLPVTAAHREAEIEQRIADVEAGRINVVSFGSGQGDRSELMTRLKAEARRTGFPEHFQHIRGVRTDPAGRIWVQRAGPSPDDAGTVDILTAERYLGTVQNAGFRLPDAFGPGGLVAWIEEDDMEAAYVRVARLPAGLR
jgi:hypothetical protein